MSSIRRIGPSSRPLPALTRGVSDVRGHARKTEVESVSRASAGLGTTSRSFRPTAPFLAQYIDQQFPWPRVPHRHERKRRVATHAYVVTDMLQDLLAETRRPRKVDETL